MNDVAVCAELPNGDGQQKEDLPFRVGKGSLPLELADQRSYGLRHGVFPAGREHTSLSATGAPKKWDQPMIVSGYHTCEGRALTSEPFLRAIERGKTGYWTSIAYCPNGKPSRPPLEGA